MPRRTPPSTHPLRLSPALARALDERARELSAESLGTVTRAGLARGLLAWALDATAGAGGPGVPELARALEAYQGDEPPARKPLVRAA